MIFLTLLYLSATSNPNTGALPTYHPSQTPNEGSLFIFNRENDRFITRSIWNIVWSCLSTIFASTWVVVHPNMPGPEDSQWEVVRRRLVIMGYLLLAPEFVIVWAARQHLDAKKVTKQFSNRAGWTRTHSFFLIMGGFTLYEHEDPLRILGVDDLEQLSGSGKIDWPTIAEKEIKDKSKGDYLSKGIVVVQTTWFIIQCIVRGANSLAITELEVTTLAFAALTGIIYYLWWDKPLDVACSIPIHMIEQTTSISSPQNIHPPRPSYMKSTKPPKPPTLTWKQCIANACRERGTFLGLLYVFVYRPLAFFLGAFVDMAGCNEVPTGQFRVPTFYSPTLHDTENDYVTVSLVILGVCVSLVFGSIHCIAWSFRFPSTQEKKLWRVSAVLISAVPLVILLISSPLRKLEEKFSETRMTEPFSLISSIVFTTAYFAYILARLALLVLPFTALRMLPEEAYLDVDWTSFLPHM